MDEIGDKLEVFRERLQYIREKRGIDRRILSQLCGLHDSAISEIERGKRPPSAGTLLILSEHFKVSVDYLLGKD